MIAMQKYACVSRILGTLALASAVALVSSTRADDKAAAGSSSASPASSGFSAG